MSTKLLATVREQIKIKLAERDTLLKERQVRQDEADLLVATAESERRDLDAKESARFRELRSQLNDIDQRLDNGEDDSLARVIINLQERETELREHVESAEKAQRAAEQWADRADTADAVMTVTRIREARTYTKESDRHGVSFFRDVYAKALGDLAAGERLDRHVRESRVHELAGYERRDIGTSAFAGLVVPQYLTELAAPAARAGAPTVAICNRHPLPDAGMTVNISRITTASATAIQSTDHVAVQETDMDDTLLTVNVRTIAGQQDVSRQALERGIGVDEIIADDLIRDYWTKLDDQILNGDGTLGTHLGIRSTTNIVSVVYTDSSPTAAELFPKLADLVQGIQSGSYMGVSHFVMHPRRFWWLASNLSSTFPLFTVPGAGVQQAGTVGSTEYSNNAGRGILGADVVLDANIPTTTSTNQDVILGVTNRELHLWLDEGAPMFIRAEQPAAGTLAVKFVVYGYSAFTAGRYPAAHGTITGTGLSTPSF